MHEEWLAKSIPVGVENAMSAQAIQEEETGTITVFNLLDNFKIGLPLTATFLVSTLGVLAISFLLNELTRRVRSGGTPLRRRLLQPRTPTLTQRIVSAVSSFGVNRLSAIGLFFVSVHLFIWLTQLFLTNNIKTNKVVVDTSNLIKDTKDLLKTPLVACMVENEQMTNMITGWIGRSTNILSKVYYEKTRLTSKMVEEREILQNSRCLITRSPTTFKLLQSKNLFLFAERKLLTFIMTIPDLVEQAPRKVWVNARKIQEYPLVFYYSRDKPRLNKMVIQHVENGLIAKTYACADQLAELNRRSAKSTLFETEAAYIENYSGFSDLSFENFRYIFLYYFLICSLIFAAFCVHHLVKFVRKRAIPIRRRLSLFVNYLSRILFWRAIGQFFSSRFFS